MKYLSIRRTLYHRRHIVSLGYLTPIDTDFKLLFEDEIEPYPRRATISLHKWMRDIHLDIFLDDFIKGIFWHLLDILESLGEILGTRKAKSSFWDIFLPDLACKIIESSKEIGMYLLQTFTRTDFDTVYHRAFK